MTILVPPAWICVDDASRSRASRRDRGSPSARRGTAPRARAPTRARARASAARRPTARARADRRALRGPTASSDVVRALARARARGTPASFERIRHVAERRRGAACTGRWNTIAWRRGLPVVAAAAPRDRPAVGSSRPWHSRSSTLLPAPFGPSITVRGPASIVARHAVDDRAAAGDERHVRRAIEAGARPSHP